MVTRPVGVGARTGLATPTFVDVFVAEVDIMVVRLVAVPAVRAELVVAIAGEPEMLAGGLTTAAAVGESVRTLANAAGVDTALLVGVIVVPVGVITGPAALVNVVLPLTVVPVTAEEPGITAHPLSPGATVVWM